MKISSKKGFAEKRKSGTRSGWGDCMRNSFRDVEFRHSMRLVIGGIRAGIKRVFSRESWHSSVILIGFSRVEIAKTRTQRYLCRSVFRNVVLIPVADAEWRSVEMLQVDICNRAMKGML